MSTTHRKMQQGTYHHNPQRQENDQNQSLRKYNQIRCTQEIGNKIIILPTKPHTPDHIVDLVKSTLRYDWYDSIFQITRKWHNPKNSMHHFYVIITTKKKLRPRIYFKVKN